MSSPAFNANQIQQPQLQNPLSDIATIMKIRQAQQLIPAQLAEANTKAQESQLQLQETQRQIADRDNLRRSYADSITVDPSTGIPTTDRAKLAQSMAANSLGDQIPAAMEGLDKIDQAHQALTESKQKVRDANAVYAAGLGAALKANNYDPDMYRQQLKTSAANGDTDPKTAEALIQQLDQLHQQDPTGKLETSFTQQHANAMMAQGGPAFTTAQARQQASQTGATELPGRLQAQENANAKAGQDAANEQFGEFSRAQAINPAPDGQAFQAAAAKLSPANYQRAMALFPPSTPYTPDLAKQTFLKAGMTAEQQEKAENPPAKTGDDFAQFYKAKLAASGQQPSATAELAARKEWAQAGSTSTNVTIATPEQMDTTAKAIAAGKIDPATARAMLRRNPGLIGQVLGVDPAFDEAQLEKRYGTAREFNNSSNAKAGGQVIALNTLIHHADLMQQAGEALQNGSFKPGNAAYNAISQMFGSAAPSNANLVARFLAGEAGKVATGGVPAEGEVNGILSSLGTSASPQQLQEAGNKILQIAAGRMTPLQEKLKDANLDKVYQVVGPDARAILQKRGFDPDTMKPVASGGAAAAPVPKTQSEFDALPKGSRFMKPGDTKVYVKQ